MEDRRGYRTIADTATIAVLLLDLDQFKHVNTSGTPLATSTAGNRCSPQGLTSGDDVLARLVVMNLLSFR